MSKVDVEDVQRRQPGVGHYSGHDDTGFSDTGSTSAVTYPEKGVVEEVQWWQQARVTNPVLMTQGLVIQGLGALSHTLSMVIVGKVQQQARLALSSV